MFVWQKRRGLPFQLLVLVTVFTFAWTFLLPHETIAQEKVQVPAGTIVLVKTNTTLNPAQLKIGDSVQLSVMSDVVIDGKTVIKAGAEAAGEITSSKERGMIGIAAQIGLAVRSVQAVDGTTIFLSGNKLVAGQDKMVMSIGLALICCILFAMMKGGDASIPAGTQIQTTVAGTATITVP